MGTIKKVENKGGITWRAWVCKHGVRDSATHDTRKEAEDWITRTEAAIIEQRHIAKAQSGRLTLAEALDWYLKTYPRSSERSQEADERRAAAIKKDPVASIPLAKLTLEDAEAWRNRRLASTTRNRPLRDPAGRPLLDAKGQQRYGCVQPQTVQRERELARAAINAAKKRKKVMLAENVFGGGLEIAGGASAERTRVFRGDERARFLAAVRECGNGQMIHAARLAVATALRLGELVALHWSDVDYETGTITVQRTYDRRKEIDEDGTVRIIHGWRWGTKTPKRGEIRRDRIPLTSEMASILDEIQPDHAQRVGIILSNVSYNSIRLAFGRATKRATLVDFVWHDLRHVAATDVSNASHGNPHMVAMLTRHRDSGQVQRYVNHGFEDFRALMDGRRG